MRMPTEANEEQQQLTSKNEAKGQFQIERVIGSGTFGKVYLVTSHHIKAQWKNKHITVALKHVFQNRRYKNRQLEILRQLKHPAIVQLYHSFYDQNHDGTYLNLAMEYVPQTLSKLLKLKNLQKQFLANEVVKKYAYWTLNALDYLSVRNISHRDIKPSNILITANNEAKLCDFGSAKILMNGQKNLAYICSRYYRAPQLIFGAVDYSTQIDIWSLGCVLGEVLTNNALFQGSSNMNQLMKIIKTIGSPSQQDYQGMKVKRPETEIIEVNGVGIESKIKKINPNAHPELLHLIKTMLVYDPHKRISPKEALSLPMFQQFQPLKDPVS